MKQIRMYVQRGCQNCDSAKKFFEDAGITVEAIEIGFDPIIQGGMRVAGNGQIVPVPVIVSFMTQEVIAGNDSVQLQRIVNDIRGAESTHALA